MSAYKPRRGRPQGSADQADERACLRRPPLALWAVLFTREAFSGEAESARLGIGVAGLVLEGFRRVDEWRLMEGTINFDQVVVLDPPAIEAIGDDKLTRVETLVLGAVDGSRTMNEVIKESTVGSFDAIKVIYQFLHSRVLWARGN